MHQRWARKQEEFLPDRHDRAERNEFSALFCTAQEVQLDACSGSWGSLSRDLYLTTPPSSSRLSHTSKRCSHKRTVPEDGLDCTLPLQHSNPHVLCFSSGLWPKERENSCCSGSQRAEESDRGLFHASPVHEQIGTTLQEHNPTVLSKRRVPVPSHKVLHHPSP